MFPRLYHLGQILYPWEHSESHNQVQNLSELIQIVLGYFITPYHGFVILFFINKCRVNLNFLPQFFIFMKLLLLSLGICNTFQTKIFGGKKFPKKGMTQYLSGKKF